MSSGLRFICREVEIGAACHVGGPVGITHRTFTDAAALESWLRFRDLEHHNYTTRECIGVEVIDEDPPHAPK